MFLGLLEQSLGKNPSRNTHDMNMLFSPTWMLILCLQGSNGRCEWKPGQRGVKISYLSPEQFPTQRKIGQSYRKTGEITCLTFRMFVIKDNYTKLNINMHMVWLKDLPLFWDLCYVYVISCLCHCIWFLIELSRRGGGVGEVGWSILW